MIDKGFLSFLCSLASLIAVIFSTTGVIIHKRWVSAVGQVLGGITQILCILFFVLHQ